MITINDTVNKSMLKAAAEEFLCKGINLYQLLDDLAIDMEGIESCVPTDSYAAPVNEAIAQTPEIEEVGFAEIKTYDYTGNPILINYGLHFNDPIVSIGLRDKNGDIFTTFTTSYVDINQINYLKITLDNPTTDQLEGTVTLMTI